MKKSNIFWCIALCFSIVFNIVCMVIPFQELQQTSTILLHNTSNIDKNNIKSLNAFVSAKFNKDKSTVDYLLFNTIKLKTVDAQLINDKQVYLGGDAYGFIYKGNGVLVIGKNLITTKDELFDNLKSNQLQAGDIIVELDNVAVKSGADISRILNADTKKQGQEVDIKAIRKGQKITTKLKPAYDLLTKKYKLGVWIKDSMRGIGTLTYIKPDNLRYGALGHPLTDSSTNAILGVDNGDIYNCEILGIKRAIRGVPGELRGVLSSNKSKGSVDLNCNNGIYGNFYDKDILENRQLIDIGSQSEIRPGSAQIFTCLDGENVRPYNIEIIKTNYHGTSNQQNLVFKVNDKRLIDATGGIVQGMSGSPIVQNGKLIGAVTHVFVNDATKGFGIFIDNMILN